MMAFRDNIVTCTREEDHPLGEALVQKRFFHALFVGLKKDTIRLSLGSLLKMGNVEDDVLMKEVNEAVACDKENRKKTKGGKAMSNSLNAEDGSKRPNNDADVNDVVLKAISKLTDRFEKLETQH